jgi:hypothetical protein
VAAETHLVHAVIDAAGTQDDDEVGPHVAVGLGLALSDRHGQSFTAGCERVVSAS